MGWVWTSLVINPVHVQPLSSRVRLCKTTNASLSYIGSYIFYSSINKILKDSFMDNKLKMHKLKKAYEVLNLAFIPQAAKSHFSSFHHHWNLHLHFGPESLCQYWQQQAWEIKIHKTAEMKIDHLFNKLYQIFTNCPWPVIASVQTGRNKSASSFTFITTMQLNYPP